MGISINLMKAIQTARLQRILYFICIQFWHPQQDITTVYVPASCTTFLQPLDADGGVNHALKNHLAEQANNFRRQQRRDALDSHGNIRLDWKPETKISMLKPVHAEWIHKSFEKVKKDKDLSRKGWEKCGIMDVIKDLVQ